MEFLLNPSLGPGTMSLLGTFFLPSKSHDQAQSQWGVKDMVQ